MNQRSSEILILGGGVTGMSAALALAEQNVTVHLVEKTDHLGGNAGNWACMATSSCQNCGACLVQEMADALKIQANAEIHTRTMVTGFSSENGTMTAVLSSGRTLAPTRIIMATGFSPFNPETFAYPRTSKRVVTTAQLNTLIRDETLLSFTGPAPRVAFLQCIGSRSRKEDRDYCSQVCCRISMRHAKKLLHLAPGARISLFYMDLQLIGKEARTAARDLAGRVELVQGVPAEILENLENANLTMVVEDQKTLSRVSRPFDLIVLSVGMTPDRDNGTTCELLGLTPNRWGFFNTGEAVSGDEVIVAGCARTPMDITGSRQDGLVAAARAVQTLDLPSGANRRPGIAVIGQGAPALAAASAAADRGYPVYSFGHHIALPPKVHDFSSAKLLSIDGYTGNFNIFYEKEGEKKEVCCAAVIASPLPDRRNRAALFPGALCLEDFTQTPPADRPGRILILLDYFGPENKASARQALHEAAASQRAGKTVYMLVRNMLVHGPTGQQAYDNARGEGVIILRFETPEDLEITPRGNGASLTLKEATLPGRKLFLEVDCLVVPGTVTPAQAFRDTAGLLRAEMDREGFLQSANVRHRPVRSPRRGIFFAGPCHDETDSRDLAAEIQAILAELELSRRAGPQKQTRPVTINEEKCARCLTCYRVCPHGAIALTPLKTPRIMPRACVSCQACVSNCPAYAIEAQGFDNNTIAARAGKGRTMILACARSGALAAGSPPAGTDLVIVPCACRISADILIKSLVNGADRVIVSGCHEGNCRSGSGTALARKQVEKAAALPGIRERALHFQTAAANEERAFARMISQA